MLLWNLFLLTFSGWIPHKAALLILCLVSKESWVNCCLMHVNSWPLMTFYLIQMNNTLKPACVVSVTFPCLTQILYEVTWDSEMERWLSDEKLRRKHRGDKRSGTPLGGWGLQQRTEVGRVIDSWQGVVLWCSWVGQNKLEGASWVLWQDGAADGEVGAHEHLKPLPIGLRNPVNIGSEGDVWLSQKTC